MKQNRPFALLPGDTVAAVLPAGPPDLARLDAGMVFLQNKGFTVRVAPGARDRVQRYLAGSDAERLHELSEAYCDPSVRALYCGRGGYGAMHLLEAFSQIVSGCAPKLLIGFSDITALGCALWRRNIPWLHAPLLTSIGFEPPEVQDHMLALAAGHGRGLELLGTGTLRSGNCEGRLLGGSLALLASMCGTPYMPDLTGALLFIEDVGEPPYRLDRMWTQLVLAGALRGVAGVIIGHLTKCDAAAAGRTPAHRGLDVLSEMVAKLDVPAASGFAFGHETPNFAVPFGGQAHFDADARRLTFSEDIVV